MINELIESMKEQMQNLLVFAVDIMQWIETKDGKELKKHMI